MRNIDDLISSLAQDASSVKITPHPYTLSIGLIGIGTLYLAVLLLFSDVRHDLSLKLGDPWFVAELVALIGIFISCSFSAALLVYPDLYQKRRIALAPFFWFIVFALIIFLAWQANNPSSLFPAHSIECTVSITLASLLPVLWAIYLMRKFASTHTHWAGGISFILVFSIGAIWIRMYEQNDSILHVVQWHYLPMVGFGIIGMWLGKTALKW